MIRGIRVGGVRKLNKRGLIDGNLSLELHSADLANRHKARTQSPLSLCPFTKNHESQTENPSVVDSASQNLGENPRISHAVRKSFCSVLLSQKVESLFTLPTLIHQRFCDSAESRF